MAGIAKWWDWWELGLPYIPPPPSMSSYRTFPLCAFCIIALKPTSEPTGRVKYSAARKRPRRFFRRVFSSLLEGAAGSESSR